MGWSAAPVRLAPPAALTRPGYRRTPLGVENRPNFWRTRVFSGWASPNVINFAPEGRLDFLSIQPHFLQRHRFELMGEGEGHEQTESLSAADRRCDLVEPCDLCRSPSCG